MNNSYYRAAGVDVEEGYRAVALMKEHVQRTYTDDVILSKASFGGLFRLGNQILVAGTDGVGTKLKIAFDVDRHDTIGIDCVAMCVNDIVCHGARPLFFLDYIATGRLYPEIVATIVEGVSEGCCQAGCALIGGETAEMPDFYKRGEYDIAGFAVGIVDADKLIDSSKVKAGDALIGFASSGIHSNGYSLVRKTFALGQESLSEYVELLGCTFGEELLKPTRIYVNTVLELNKKFDLHGVAHITGGGFYENIPRILPEGLRAKVELGNWEVPRIFEMIRSTSAMEFEEMFGVFNMGIGMVLAVPGDQAQQIAAEATALGEKAVLLGSVVEGESGVELCK